MARQSPPENRTLPALFIGAGAWWVWQNSGPIMAGAEINPLPAIAASLTCMCGLIVVTDALKALGDVFDWFGAQQTTGLKGTSGLIKNLRELGEDFQRRGWGPYWGAWKGKTEVVSSYSSIAYSAGTTGSGKSSGIVIPTALSIQDSAAHTDFKGSLTCQLAPPMKARGDDVRILNFGNLFTDILGPSDCYNPMHIITDCFKRPGGLLEVGEILQEKALQIYPEPEGQAANGDNSYFRNGSRELIEFAILICCLIDGEDATMGDAAQLLSDREALARHALWAAGRLRIETPEPALETDAGSDDASGTPPTVLN